MNIQNSYSVSNFNCLNQENDLSLKKDHNFLNKTISVIVKTIQYVWYKVYVGTKYCINKSASFLYKRIKYLSRNEQRVVDHHPQIIPETLEQAKKALLSIQQLRFRQFVDYQKGNHASVRYFITHSTSLTIEQKTALEKALLVFEDFCNHLPNEEKCDAKDIKSEVIKIFTKDKDFLSALKSYVPFFSPEEKKGYKRLLNSFAITVNKYQGVFKFKELSSDPAWQLKQRAVIELWVKELPSG
jgi:hypothetical protein